MSDIYQGVVEILTTYARKLNGTKITVDSDILDDLGVNSARVIDIVLAVEDRFGIKIEEREEEAIQTVGDIVSLVEKKKSG